MFILRTAQMPSIQKLLELERIVVVDNAGQALLLGAAGAQACVVGECLSGPFLPTVVTSPGDVQQLYFGTPSRFTLISQNNTVATNDGSTPIQDGGGVMFDGNVWAELKGKTLSGLVIQRVDCDMLKVATAAKAFVKFAITVAAAEKYTSGGNDFLKVDLLIPAGTRFGDASANNLIATSQDILIAKGTELTAGKISVSDTVSGGPLDLVQDATTGRLSMPISSVGVKTGGAFGATCFFVKGTVTSGNPVTTCFDTAIPGYASTIDSTASTVDAAGSTTTTIAPGTGSTLAAQITSLYAVAINKTLPGVAATDNIIAIWSARNWACSSSDAKSMRTNLQANAVAASAVGRGRVACVTSVPAADGTASSASTAKTAYEGLVASDGIVGADADRFWLSGPYVQVFSTELNQDITVSACGTRAAMKVNLANAGQSEYLTSVGTPYNANIQQIDAQEAAFAANALIDTDFVALKAAGVSWLVRDRSAGWWFYSGVTAANPITYSNRVDDNRRSFADEIQDIIVALAAKYSKLPGTVDRQDAIVSDLKAYIDPLVNPPPGIEQRAKAYSVDDGATAGNTEILNASDIFMINVVVQMNGSFKTIAFNTAVGTNVVVTQVS